MKYNNKAFTLVELAIVITIIGLLIGGVLKGQELLENSRLTAMANQVKAYEAGILTFRDVYKALPGDMVGATNFIQGCTASPCNVDGDANGRIGPVFDGSDTTITTPAENRAFWLQLSKAGLITGIDSSYIGTPNVFGRDFPAMPMGGGFHVINKVQAGTSFLGRTFEPRNGHYLLTSTTPGTIEEYGPGVLSPLQASNLDRKIDDGTWASGNIIGFNANHNSYSAGNACIDSINGRVEYAPLSTKLCLIGIKLDI